MGVTWERGLSLKGRWVGHAVGGMASHVEDEGRKKRKWACQFKVMLDEKEKE